MKWLPRLLILMLVCGFLYSCGGTGTGNPEAQHQINDGVLNCDPQPYVCSDDSLVYRNLENDCEFDPCP